MLQPMVLLSLIRMGLALEKLVTIDYQWKHLSVKVDGAPDNSSLRIFQIDPRASTCANSQGAVVIWKDHQISNHSKKAMKFPTDDISPGKYCAEVVSPSGNFMSEWPAEIKEESGADGVRQPNCRLWNATVNVVGSYTVGTIRVNVSEFQNNGCQKLRVTLWQVMSGAASTQYQPCKEDYIADEKTEPMELGWRLLGNELKKLRLHHAQLTPVCDPFKECLTLKSKAIELPTATVEHAPRGPETNQGRIIWLLMLALLVGAAAAIGIFFLWARRKALSQPKRLSTIEPPLSSSNRPRLNSGLPVVKVVYSRDSEAHMTVVSQLCLLIQNELGMRVEWDEAANGATHVTHDWAIAMAQLPCPRFNPAAIQAADKKAPEIIVVLESDGALLKHEAYRQHKDLGAVSESNIDELYHTTYAALLSNQAQALGDYCHILVARLPYTTLPIRLDLVPEKRYLLPDHLHQLLAQLLYATSLPEDRADAALSSGACNRFRDALANASNAHDKRGFAADSLCGKLQAMLQES